MSWYGTWIFRKLAILSPTSSTKLVWISVAALFKPIRLDHDLITIILLPILCLLMEILLSAGSLLAGWWHLMSL